VHGRIRSALKQVVKVVHKKQTFIPVLNAQYKVVSPLTWYKYVRKGCCGGLKPALGGVIAPGTVLTYKEQKPRRTGYPNGQVYLFVDGTSNSVLLSTGDTPFLERV